MALSDLAIFNEQTYTVATEVLQQQVELFNAATRGALAMTTSAAVGDYNEAAFFAKIAGGLVRRRNPRGVGAIAKKSLAHKTMVSVKVAAGTPALDLSPGQFRWIQQSPDIAAATFGKQLAVDMLADMLGVSVTALVAAIGQHAAVTKDIATKPDIKTFNEGARLFGDMHDRLACWVMHSHSMFDVIDSNIANTTELFRFESIVIRADAFGRPWVITDEPALQVDVDSFRMLGLVSGACTIGDNGDYDATIVDKTGDENILREMQAEWSYQLELKGYSWDKAGGAAPNNAAIGTAANWDKYATDFKDTAGVLLNVGG